MKTAWEIQLENEMSGVNRENHGNLNRKGRKEGGRDVERERQTDRLQTPPNIAR